MVFDTAFGARIQLEDGASRKIYSEELRANKSRCPPEQRQEQDV
jgi:hypothetical protein